MEKLIEAIKIAALGVIESSKPVEVQYGTVTSVKPLEIIIESISYDEDFLTLSRNVTDFKTEISFDNPSIVNDVDGYLTTDPKIKINKLSFQSGTKNQITIYNGLKEGERIILLREQGGQKYLVWDRVG